MAEIKLTNANSLENFISFSVDGLKDQLQVGITGDPNSHGQALSIAYKGQVYVFPFSVNSKEIKLINAQYDTSEYFNDENPLEDMFENGGQVKIGNLYADKETYEWLTTPSEEDDDIGDWRENTVFTDEPDPERVEACKEIFEGVDKVPVEITEAEEEHDRLGEVFGLFECLKFLDELGINETNYATFRSVIQEHCFNKYVFSLDEIKETWMKFKDGLENISEHIKKI